MKLVARKIVNSLDKEIIINCGSEYFIIKTVQVVNTSELQWLSLTESQVDMLIKKHGFKIYIIEERK